MVAHRPGDWFAETLESIARQDYEPLDTVIIDAAGSGIDTAALAEAAVIDASGAAGFSEAANAVLSNPASAPDGASRSADHLLSADYLLVCHDDVALAPDAVRVLVQEALTSNAGIVGPKIVDWDSPEIIRGAGLDVDRFGVSAPRVGVDELDQEQHDGVSDVFAVPSAAMLIRTELFVRLGGFDSGMSFRGEDVDLCWRAQMAGARVVFAGGATARHRGRLTERTGVDDVRLTATRHALRSMLVNHGRISLAVMLPMAFAMALLEMGVGVVTARLARVRDVASAWIWNINRLEVVAQRRRANSEVRRVRQADVTALQYFGSVRLMGFVRRHTGGESPGVFRAAGRDVIGGLRAGSSRLAWVVWMLVMAFVLFGSRGLIADGVAVVGDFALLGDSGAELLGDWWRGWSERGAGSPSSNLGVLVYLGATGWLLADSMELIRTVSVLAAIVVGLVGAYRLLAATGSRRAQAATLVAYLLVPLAGASVASGSLAGLIGYAIAPWMLRELLRSLQAAPFGTAPDRWRGPFAAAAPLGATAGLAALVAPAAAGLVGLIGAGLIAGSLLAGRPAGVARLCAATVLAVPTAALLALPLVVDVLASGPTWSLIADGRDGSAGDVSFAQMLRFALGPDGSGPVVWLFAVPMFVPLLLGRGWRLEQSIRLWMVAAAAWALALVAQRGLLPFGLPDLHLLLAPAGVAVAALCGLAVVSIEHDLRFSHFGWRQALLPVTVAAALVLAAGNVGALEDGRWGQSGGDHRSSLRLEAPVLSGSYRVLWIGAPEFLPMQGRPLAGGVAWATTSGDTVTLADRAVPVDLGRADLFETVIGDIEAGRTTRAGRLLGGLGVRYVVLLHRLVPAPFATADEAQPVPADLDEALRRQLDLALVEGTNRAVDVFENTSWVPMRALYPLGFDAGISEFGDLEARPLSAGSALFSSDDPPWTAQVPPDLEVLAVHTPRPGWELSVNGEMAARREALSWSRAYLTGAGGEARLSYSAPWWRHAAQIIGAVAPLALILVWLRRRLDAS